MTDEEITTVVLEESRNLEKFLNEDILLRFGRLHNIDDSQNRFVLKQEIVARGAYFLEVKKKYALHVTNMEGVPVNELDTKGLVTKRSDYPSLTKSKIQKMIDMLVMSPKIDREEIDRFDKETEGYIRSLCVAGMKEVCRPVSYSKEDSAYKKAPIQIEGMKLWNTCEYEIFVPGTRGYLYKILGINWQSPNLSEGAAKNQAKLMTQKLNYVVIPTEEPKLPDYFIIDVDAMLKFAWIDRVEELLIPLGGRFCNKKSNIESDVFTFDV